jgi:GNAT superfamily N-acetyltransferase
LSETVIRQAAPKDIPGILQLQFESYPTLSRVAQWRAEHLEAHQRVFPEGQFVAILGKRVVGVCSTLITRSEIALRPHTFRDVTAKGTFATHDPTGDTLYGAEIMVHPDARRRGIASRFYEARFALARRLGLRYFVAGGRLPGYGPLRDRMTVRSYIRSVEQGRRTDRVLSAQLKNGLKVADVMPDYLNDPNSANFATLLVWENPLGSARTTAVPRGRAAAQAPPAGPAEAPGGPKKLHRKRSPPPLA